MAARHRWQYLLLFFAYLSLCLAASPTSFCKCTCFTNSTIIPLDAKSGSSNSKEDSKVKTRSCQDCSKQFCLEYNLPICSDATEADVFTTCFQRDSTKDELVVFIFIFVTVGLLAWAGAKPIFEKWQANRQVRQTYAPVSDHDDEPR